MLDASDETGARHLGTFWMLRLDQPLAIGPAPRVRTVFTRAGPEIVQELARTMEFDDPTAILQRFTRGCHGYIARIEGKLAAYGWVTFDEESIGELGLSIRLKTGDAYIWDCATLPAYRGQRLYPALLAYMLNELQSEGLRRVWIGTDADNLPSQSGVALVGFQPIVDILMTRVLTIRRLWARGRPGVPEQVVMGARSALLGNRDQAWLTAITSSWHKQPGS